jgi:hypothetical protein
MSVAQSSAFDFMRWVGRYCVAVTWADRAPSESAPSDAFAFSGFIISVRGQWILVTAGHVAEDIRSRLDRGREFCHAEIVDVWSDGTIDNHAIPFPNIVRAPTVPQGYVYQDETGIDYAWYLLPDYYRKLLAANGIVALDEGAWKHVPDNLDRFNAFGFPSELARVERGSDGRYKGIRVCPRLVPYSLVRDPPEGCRLSFRRLFFRPNPMANGEIPSVDGMSGCPIFGYQAGAEGTSLFLVAIQSTQLSISRLATGCPARLFGLAFEHEMEKFPHGEI